MDTYKIDYSEENKNKIRMILASLSNVDGIRLSLVSDHFEKYLEASLTTDEYSSDQLKSIIDYIILSSEIDNTKSKMDEKIEEFYHKFEELNIDEKVEFRIENNRVTLHTNSEKLREQLENAGTSLENSGFEVTDETFRALENPIEKESEVTQDLLPSKVNIYEKVVKDKFGNNIIARLSIVKQNKEDSQYDRLVTMTYVGKDNQVLSTPEVIGYENGPDFDNNILPSVLDGFTKNVTLSGNDVEVDEQDATKVWMQSGDQQQPIQNFSVTGEKSILTVMDENNMNENVVDVHQMVEDGILKEQDAPSQTFEETVTEENFTNDNELNQEESLEKEQSYQYVKRLSPPNHFGLGTVNSFTMFIIIDLIAMAVGILLLLS